MKSAIFKFRPAVKLSRSLSHDICGRPVRSKIYLAALTDCMSGSGDDKSGRKMFSSHYPEPFLPTCHVLITVSVPVYSHFRYRALAMRLRLKSRRISRAALWPGAPVTPPPGWPPEPHK